MLVGNVMHGKQRTMSQFEKWEIAINNLENIHQGIHIFFKNSACLETEINLKVSLIIDNKL